MASRVGVVWLAVVLTAIAGGCSSSQGGEQQAATSTTTASPITSTSEAPEAAPQEPDSLPPAAPAPTEAATPSTSTVTSVAPPSTLVCPTDGLIVAGDHGVAITEECSTRSLISGRRVEVALDDHDGGIVFQYESEAVAFGGEPLPYQPIYWWRADAPEPEILIDEGDREWGTFVLHDTGVVDGNAVVLYTSVFQEIDPNSNLIQATIRDTVLDLATGESIVVGEYYTESPLESSITARLAVTPSTGFSYVRSPIAFSDEPCGEEFDFWSYGYEFFDAEGAPVSVPGAPSNRCDDIPLGDGVVTSDAGRLIYSAWLLNEVVVRDVDLATGELGGSAMRVPDMLRLATQDDLILISRPDENPNLYRGVGSPVEVAPISGVADFVRSESGVRLAGGYEAPPAAASGSRWTITPTSVGPAEFGMPVGELSAQTGVTWTIDDQEGSCTYATAESRGVSARAIDGIVTDFIVWRPDGGITEEGAKVGDGFHTVLGIYGDRAAVVLGDFGGEEIVVDGRDNYLEYSYIFDLGPDGSVTEILIADRPGRIEGGCS